MSCLANRLPASSPPLATNFSNCFKSATFDDTQWRKVPEMFVQQAASQLATNFKLETAWNGQHTGEKPAWPPRVTTSNLNWKLPQMGNTHWNSPSPTILLWDPPPVVVNILRIKICPRPCLCDSSLLENALCVWKIYMKQIQNDLCNAVSHFLCIILFIKCMKKALKKGMLWRKLQKKWPLPE